MLVVFVLPLLTLAALKAMMTVIKECISLCSSGEKDEGTKVHQWDEDTTVDMPDDESTRAAEAAAKLEEEELRIAEKLHIAELQQKLNSISTQHDAMVQSKLKQIVHRMTNDKIGSSFEVWIQLAAHAKRVKNVLRKSKKRLMHQSISICFEKWSSDVLDGKNAAKEAALQKALTDANEDLAVATAKKLHIAELEQKLNTMTTQHDAMVQSKLKQIVLRMKHDSIGSSFHVWVQLAVHAKRVKNVLHKAKMRLMNQSMSICFEKWSSDVLDGKNAAKEAALQKEIKDANEDLAAALANADAAAEAMAAQAQTDAKAKAAAEAQKAVYEAEAKAEAEAAAAKAEAEAEAKAAKEARAKVVAEAKAKSEAKALAEAKAKAAADVEMNTEDQLAAYRLKTQLSKLATTLGITENASSGNDADSLQHLADTVDSISSKVADMIPTNDTGNADRLAANQLKTTLIKLATSLGITDRVTQAQGSPRAAEKQVGLQQLADTVDSISSKVADMQRTTPPPTDVQLLPPRPMTPADVARLPTVPRSMTQAQPKPLSAVAQHLAQVGTIPHDCMTILFCCPTYR
jgi:TolA protein